MFVAKPELRAKRWQPLLVAIAGASLSLACVPSVRAFAPLSGPILASSAVPPNVVILFDNSSSMRGDVNADYADSRGRERLEIARDAVTEVISDNRNLRFGLFVFNDTTGTDNNREAHGGRRLVSVDSVDDATSAGRAHYSTLIKQLNAIDPVVPGTNNQNQLTYTPLAESYYEITRYMRGLRPFYSPAPPTSTTELNDRPAFQSPIQYRCQRSVGLIVTDGLPTYDSQFPATIETEPDAGPLASGQTIEDKLRNWYDPFSDNLSSTDLATEGGTFFLNDIARFAYDIDMRNAARDGADNAGVSWDDPAFPRQNMRTYTIGFTVDDPQLSTMAEAGNGRYYTTSDSAQLTGALQSVLLEINAAAGSGGGGVASGPDLQTDSIFYRAQYDPQDWSGRIEAVQIQSNGQLGGVVWSTDNTITPSTRGHYQTYRLPGGSGAEGVATINANIVNSMPAEQQRVLRTEAAIAGLGNTNANAQELIEWTRGTRVKGLRERSYLLGDVINTDLAFARPADRTAPASIDYDAYARSKVSSLVPSLVFGANDGILHVINAVNGTHRLAYLPLATYTTLGGRARSDFPAGSHLSGVDGKIAIGDVQLGNNSIWTTLAVGGLGAGGKGMYAVRVYDAAQGNDALGALWEVGPHLSHDWQHMGYTYSQPQIARLNGQWVAIAGNGYGSNSGHAALYIIDLENGDKLAEITVHSEGGNGLSTPALVTDSSGNVTGAYAGDLAGNLWKFDLSGTTPESWGNALGANPLFTTEPNQPITVTPQWNDHPNKGRLVMFGTGKFLESADRTDLSEQAFYAVWDRPEGKGNLTSSNLLEQRITSEYQLPSISDSGVEVSLPVRTIDEQVIDWSTSRGWKLPLIYDGDALGERVTKPFLLSSGRVIFTTGFIRNDNDDPCTTSGDGWLMVLNIFSGAMLSYPVLDTNRDGQVGSGDVVVAGMRPGVGLPGGITAVRGTGVEHYLIQGSDGASSVAGLALDIFRRIMWRQLM